MAVHDLIKKIKEPGLTEHRKGSDQPITTTEQNMSIIRELVCLQDDEPDTHNFVRGIP